jgi:E3 ubiquitin-protein ligase RAD18
VLKRPALPKLVLRVMKDAELRKKMKEFGLSTQGDRKTLENRFTRYSVIYNAECDKLVPRAVVDLIRQCEMEEKQERKMDSFLVSGSISNVCMTFSQ